MIVRKLSSVTHLDRFLELFPVHRLFPLIDAVDIKIGTNVIDLLSRKLTRLVILWYAALQS
jgi:hypothetical protein